MHPIYYLDHAATTPMHPEVIAVYTEAMNQFPGNASSIHGSGRTARAALDAARKRLADSIHAQVNEIIFTAGGTEADNLAIIGTARANAHKGKHLITTAIEHHAILRACQYLEHEGFEVTYLVPDEQGIIHAQQVREALREDTILVSIMYANNEVGAIQPVEEIGHLLNEKQVLYHIDAVQAYGMLPIRVDELNVDLLSVSAHKLNGPKGIGFLYVRSDSSLQPLTYGGDQERKRRAGTENVPAAHAFAKAVELATDQMMKNQLKYEQFKKQIVTTLQTEKIAYFVHCEEADTLPHVLSVSFIGTDVESLLVNLDLAGIQVSSGSACTAGAIEPSHVLTAMYGEGTPFVRNAIRFSFGYGVTKDVIQQVVAKLVPIVRRLAK